MSLKRKPKKRRAPARPAPKKKLRKPAPVKRSKGKRAPPKTKKRARSEAAKRGWATRRKNARALARERDSDRGDVVVVSKEPGAWEPVADYRPYPMPDRGKWIKVDPHGPAAALERLQSLFPLTKGGDYHPEIEWFPTFDEVYDYIDALVDEYDLDAHELFELAYGYLDEVAA